MGPCWAYIFKTGVFSEGSILESHFGQFTKSFVDFVIGLYELCALKPYLLLIVF